MSSVFQRQHLLSFAQSFYTQAAASECVTIVHCAATWFSWIYSDSYIEATDSGGLQHLVLWV